MRGGVGVFSGRPPYVWLSNAYSVNGLTQYQLTCVAPNVPKFIGWGLKSVGNAEIRDAYKAYVDRKLIMLGLDLPDERAHRRFL